MKKQKSGNAATALPEFVTVFLAAVAAALTVPELYALTVPGAAEGFKGINPVHVAAMFQAQGARAVELRNAEREAQAAELAKLRAEAAELKQAPPASKPKKSKAESGSRSSKLSPETALSLASLIVDVFFYVARFAGTVPASILAELKAAEAVKVNNVEVFGSMKSGVSRQAEAASYSGNPALAAAVIVLCGNGGTDAALPSLNYTNSYNSAGGFHGSRRALRGIIQGVTNRFKAKGYHGAEGSAALELWRALETLTPEKRAEAVAAFDKRNPLPVKAEAESK